MGQEGGGLLKPKKPGKPQKTVTDVAAGVQRAIGEIETKGGTFRHFFVTASGYDVEIVVRRQKD